MMAAIGRATGARALAALTILFLAVVQVHAQCPPPQPFADQRVYYHLDQVGSVNLLTDHTGGVVRESRHYPYGEFVGGPPAASPSPFGFSSHRTVDSHGFAYFEARYYVPELAVFASRDPAAQFQNPYSYGEGDPLSLRDPDGKWFIPAIVGLLFVGELLLDGVLNPIPENQGSGLLTAEQQVLQPAPNPVETLAGGVLVGGVAGVADDVGRGVAGVADDLGRNLAGGADDVIRGAAAMTDDVAARGGAGKLYHYTGADPAKIAAEGLKPGASGKVFTTPTGNLSPLQAQIDLALPPNRGLPGHLLEIDVGTLQRMGVQVPEAGQVGRMFNVPGGGAEVVFPHAIPAEAIRVVR